MLDVKVVTKDGHTITARPHSTAPTVVLTTVNKVGHVVSVELTEDELEELRTVLSREWMSL